MKPIKKHKNKFKINTDLEIDLTILNKVFYPTHTSNLLINSCLKKIKKPSKILDIGCGSGIVGISLSNMGKTSAPVHFSDISKQAIKNVKINASKYNIDFIAKSGSLFDPWKDMKFDYIVNDVSGISEEIAAKSKWYKGVSCKTGISGTKLVNKIIARAKFYLNTHGALIIPIISLSNENNIIKNMKKYFSKINKIGSGDWPLPESMYAYEKILEKLRKKSYVNYKKKWGYIICSTSVYMLKN